MKKYLIITIFLALTLIYKEPVKAEEATVSLQAQVAQAETDYRLKFDQYRTVHDVYVTAKSEFLKSGNLKSQQDALVAAKAAATARAEVLRTYTKWIALQLTLYQSPFPQVNSSISALAAQTNWYVAEEARIQATQTQDAFQAVMDDYIKTQDNRDRLYAQAQIDLKLGQVAYFQQQARALYDPLLNILQTKTTVPEIAQGIAKVADLGNQINKDILDTKTKSGAIESGDLSVYRALSQTSDKLEILRTKELTLVNTMMELESRYGQ